MSNGLNRVFPSSLQLILMFWSGKEVLISREFKRETISIFEKIFFYIHLIQNKSLVEQTFILILNMPVVNQEHGF